MVSARCAPGIRLGKLGTSSARGGSFFPVSGIICMRFNLSKFVRSNALLTLMLKFVSVVVSAQSSIEQG
jgi:hypothetical protein